MSDGNISSNSNARELRSRITALRQALHVAISPCVKERLDGREAARQLGLDKTLGWKAFSIRSTCQRQSRVTQRLTANSSAAARQNSARQSMTIDFIASRFLIRQSNRSFDGSLEIARTAIPIAHSSQVPPEAKCGKVVVRHCFL